MSMEKCRNCPQLELLSSERDGSTGRSRWETSELSVHHLREQNVLKSHFTIIYVDASKIRDCSRCRRTFIEIFKMPEIWWTTLYHRANGYFGFEDTVDEEGDFDGFNTWTRFHIKHPVEQKYGWEPSYVWYKYNIFTRWLPNPDRSIVILFDPLPSINRQAMVPLLASMTPHDLDDHFFMYTIIAGEVARVQDDAVWSVRGLVFTIETKRTITDVPTPEFPHLHDLATTAIHTTETLEMAVHAVDCIISYHNAYVAKRQGSDKKMKLIQKRIQDRLAAHRSVLFGLQLRSVSNKERIMNEIQLAFNSVAQFESHISVEIGRAAQVDSAAMKIVAFVTLVFFPATFVSGLFGMSFFEFDADSDQWSMSSEIWIFWLISVALTAATALICAFWQKLFPPPEIGARKYSSILSEKN